jgi:hypothetical protein
MEPIFDSTLYGPKVAERQLLVRLQSQGRLHVRLELQVDEVADIEGTVGATLVRLRLHALLCSMKMKANRGQHCFALVQHSLHVSHRRGAKGTERQTNIQRRGYVM